MSVSGGIEVLDTYLEFNNNVFEIESVEAAKDTRGNSIWTITYDDQDKRIHAEADNYIKNSTEICVIKMKVKAGAAIDRYTIKAKSSEAATPNATTGLAELISAEDVVINIDVKTVGLKETSKYLMIEGMIKNIDPMTTIASFKDNFVGNIGTIQDKNNNIITSTTETIKSGMKLKISDTEVYELSVKGDLNGDGKADSSDVVKMRMSIIHLATLTGVYEAAADINQDGRPADSSDFARLLDYVAGIQSTM